MPTIEELEAQLRDARKAEEATALAERLKVPVVWRYTIARPTDRFDWIYDDTCVFYRLSSEVTNLEEAKAVGWPDYELRAGGMKYVFNTGTGRIVCSVGGGTIYISKPWAGDADNDSHVVAMRELSEFIVAHPDGGDVTAIVLAHQARRRA